MRSPEGAVDPMSLSWPAAANTTIRIPTRLLDIPAISAIETDAFESHVVHPRIMFSPAIKRRHYPWSYARLLLSTHQCVRITARIKSLFTAPTATGYKEYSPRDSRPVTHNDASQRGSIALERCRIKAETLTSQFSTHVHIRDIAGVACNISDYVK